VIKLDGATVMLQWATGGLFFLWFTLRRGIVSVGYGWLLRSIYLVFAVASAFIGIRVDVVPLRDATAILMALATAAALLVSIVRRTADASRLPSPFDVVAPVFGLVGLLAAGVHAGDPALLSVVRTLVGAAFLGGVSDAMLLGHWYLVQPGLSRAPLNELVRAVGVVWPLEVAALLWLSGWCRSSTARSTTATPGCSVGSGSRARSRRSC